MSERLRGELTPLTQREAEYLAFRRMTDPKFGKPLTISEIAKRMGIRLNTAKKLAQTSKEKVDAIRLKGTSSSEQTSSN